MIDINHQTLGHKTHNVCSRERLIWIILKSIQTNDH